MSDYGKFTAPATLEIVRSLPGPIERVWDHLVDPQLRQKWFAGGATAPHAGGAIVFEFDHRRLSAAPPPAKYKNSAQARFVGTVLEFRPPHRLAFTWLEADGKASSKVTITLSEQGRGVRLHLVHEHLHTEELRIGVAAGWHAHLDLLSDLLGGRAARDFWPRHTDLEGDYAARLVGAGH